MVGRQTGETRFAEDLFDVQAVGVLGTADERDVGSPA
jgi:hypothetical protein